MPQNTVFIPTFLLVLAVTFSVGCKKQPLQDCCASAYSVIDSGQVYAVIPNAFSPNRDGRNDYFAPYKGSVNSPWLVLKKITITSGSTVLFDAYGSWDGTYQGHTMPDGTYHFVVEMQNTNSGLVITTEGEVCLFSGTCIEDGYVNKCEFGDSYNTMLDTVHTQENGCK